MNCKQFENRVQQLLDERSSLALDLPLQQHARQCGHCQYALTVYEGISELHGVAIDSPATIASLSSQNASQNDQPEWKSRQRRSLRNRMVLAAAAILFISLTLVPRPPATAPVVMLEPAPVNVKETAAIPANMDPAFFSSMDFSGLISDWTGRLPNASYVDLTSIGRIDLTSLVPERPVRAMQSIPATIQPIYDYSVDLPVVNQWSIGINYTIGLIQNSLSTSGSSQPATDDDQGSQKTVTMPDIC